MKIECPVLPPEIWTRIIDNLANEDGVSAWLNCRPVSRMFQSATEWIFMRRHIRTLKIQGQLGMEGRLGDDQPSPPSHLMAPGNPERLELPHLLLAFDRFSDDGERVILSEATAFHPELRSAVSYAYLLKEAKNAFSDIMSYYAEPPTHNDAETNILLRKQASRLSVMFPYLSADLCNRLAVISNSHHAHEVILEDIHEDAEIPELEFDLDNVELSFKWKPMLTLLYGKHEYERRLRAKHRVLDMPITSQDLTGNPRRFQPKLDKIWDIRGRISKQIRHKQLIKCQQRLGVSIPSDILQEANNLPNFDEEDGCIPL